MTDALDEYREERKEEELPDIPYTNAQLMKAISLDYETGSEGQNDPKFEWLNEHLQEPTDITPSDPNQLELPGMVAKETDLSSHLTEEMRDDMKAAILKAFNKEAEHKADHMEPPDLEDSAQEIVDMYWNEMSDKESFAWAKEHTDLIEDDAGDDDKADQYINSWDDVTDESKAKVAAEYVKLKSQEAKEEHPSVADYVIGAAAQGKWQQMTDLQKLSWAKAYADQMLEKPSIPLPEKFDPLGKDTYNAGKDYRRTQVLARAMSNERSAQVILDRGLAHVGEIVGTAKGSPEWKAAAAERMREYVADMDKRLWSDWKSSSTSEGGELLQVAIADELGARLRTDHFKDGRPDKIIARANDRYAPIGGYEGVKAYVRAKWETTQYLLDKADLQKLQLYRAVNIPVSESEAVEITGEPGAINPVRRWTRYPNVTVARNGAASMTAKPSVANEWNGQTNRVVLRAEVPRTAVVSVPAYGINITEEQEVVVAGTGWVGWDAWKEDAPEFDTVPLGAKGEPDWNTARRAKDAAAWAAASAEDKSAAEQQWLTWSNNNKAGWASMSDEGKLAYVNVAKALKPPPQMKAAA